MGACPTCTTENRDTARFCVRCGTTLGGAGTDPGAGATAVGPSGSPTGVAPAAPPPGSPPSGAGPTAIGSVPPPGEAGTTPPPETGTTPPASQAEPKPKRKGLVPIVVTVALLAGLGGGYLYFGQGAEASTIYYEAPNAAGPDPFTSPVDVSAASVGATIPTPDPASGGTLQPFGGSGVNTVCDREQLIAFLEANPDKRRAWAEALGIDPDTTADYIRKLKPVTLTQDTRVTNHRFENGRAVPIQSILPAGTAVLVDEDGNPRVRCRCGNPLLEPTAVGRAVCPNCPDGYTPPQPLAAGVKPSFVEVINPPGVQGGDVSGTYSMSLTGSSGACPWDPQTTFQVTQTDENITIEDVDPEFGTGSFAATLNDDGTYSGSDGSGGSVSGRFDGTSMEFTASSGGCTGNYAGSKTG